MKRYAWIVCLTLPFALSACSTIEDLNPFDDDEEEIAAESQTQPTHKYITINVKDRYAFRIKDPLGKRTTGGSCGSWKDQQKDTIGECCWNSRGECGCPCPER